jgi:hypothetical protein
MTQDTDSTRLLLETLSRAGYTVHPAANLFPPMDDDAYYEFVGDVRARGLQQPIRTLKGAVLEGRHRLAACIAAKIEPRFEALPEDTDPFAYVVSANLHRRHLATSQKAIVGAKMVEMLKEAARERRRAGKSADGSAGGRGKRKQENLVPNSAQGFTGRSRQQAADIVGVGTTAIDQGQKVITRGVPELVEMVLSGGVAVSAAAAVAGLPAKEQKEAVAGGKSGVRRKATEVRQSEVKAGPDGKPITVAKAKQRGQMREAAFEAVIWLRQLPDDAKLRKLGYQIVVTYIMNNGGRDVVIAEARKALEEGTR